METKTPKELIIYNDSERKNEWNEFFYKHGSLAIYTMCVLERLLKEVADPL